MKFSLIIPCLNEAATITQAVAQAHNIGRALHTKNSQGAKQFEVIVVDNGSTDRSVQLVKKQRLARLIVAPIRGYGAALHWGILHARGEYVGFADADLSYDFAEFAHFDKVIKKMAPDLILGSRFKGVIQPGAMPVLNRYLGTPVLTRLIRWIYGLQVSDSNSGMRVVRRNFYHKLRMRNAGMEWASELLIKTALHRGKYTEVPITLHPDQRTRQPHLLRWTDGWRHLKAIILLKPSILLVPITLSTLLGVLTFQFSTALSFYLFLLAFALFLATTAAQLLQFAIDQTESLAARATQHLPLVVIAGTLTTVGLGILVWFPSNLPQLRMFLGSCIVLFDMWVFLIETIKTHVLYQLPDEGRIKGIDPRVNPRP